MKLQKTTLILLITALFSVGFVYFYEIRGKQAIVTQKNEKKIFNFTEKEIKSFTIERGKEVLEFEKTTDELLPWAMIKPDQVKAEDAAVSFLINPLVNDKIKESFSISEDEKVDYGLDQPIAKLTIKLNNNQTHQLIFGKTNFDEQFIYTLIDPIETSPLTVNLLPINLKHGVERPLDEWKKQENIDSQNEKDKKENEKKEPD